MTPASMDGRFECGRSALAYALAGNARLTLVSGRTGTRFTFRVRDARGDGDDRRFVAVLRGPDNGGDYEYLGTIFPGRPAQKGWGDSRGVHEYKPEQPPRYAHGRKSRVSQDAPSARAFAWAWGFLSRGELPPGCEVWHDGRCGRCGRPLTVPESVATGLGPVCAGKEAA